MALLAACVFAPGSIALGQDQQQPDQQPPIPQQPGGQQPGQVSNQLTTVHGMVRVGASGQPLSHALVRINGDASSGMLTDGDGRFEIADVPQGPLDFTVAKPGYLDTVEAVEDSIAWNAHGYGHNVIVAPGMGDVVFTMEPCNSIRGQIQISTGDLAEGIVVTLLKKTIQDGRAVWQTATNTKTNSEGVYRFGELSDGFYAVFTMPAMDSDTAEGLTQTGTAGRIARGGYASVFFPDARDLAGAAKIHLAAGEQAQANIALALEPFKAVVANVTMPRAGGRSENVSVQVLDAQGHMLPYTAQYDPGTHTAQAMLPDGTYSLLASMLPNMLRIATARNNSAFTLTPVDSQVITGQTSFAVAGRAVLNLHLPMAASAIGSVQVSLSHGANSSATRGEPDPQVIVTLSQTGGWMADGMVSSYAEGPSTGPLQSNGAPPGSYWVHTNIGPKTLCESSFTAGGASLARDPLMLGPTGTAAPLMLALRDDCARLTLSLPGSVGYTTGEEHAYIIYVVPDFDSTEDVVPVTLRPSTGGRMTITGLTPGNYHVFAFDRPVALAYRNRAALGALPGQAVSVGPEAETNLTVEVPQQ
jgi:hypothetical protein